MAEQVADLLGGEHEVDRDEDHPCPCGGEYQYGVLPAVVRQERQPIACLKAIVAQRRSRAVHQVLELGETEHDITVDDRDLVGGAARRPAGDITERMPACARDGEVKVV
ncbi:hypothetical protein A5695_09950 [Mycobacterium sp. E1747]|nr:hypothetical protein A5695_09950 [Mycobacterium sp. E1747]